MNENGAQPAEEKGHWWFVWIMTTVIAPGVTAGLLATQQAASEVILGIAALLVFVLHLVSSLKLGKGGSGWLTAGLVFGGWALMGVSFFVGCLALVSIN